MPRCCIKIMRLFLVKNDGRDLILLIVDKYAGVFLNLKEIFLEC